MWPAVSLENTNWCVCSCCACIVYIVVQYFFWVLYQSYIQELFLHVFVWSNVVYKAHVLSDWSVILDDDSRGILEALEELLVCLDFMLPSLEHQHVGLPNPVSQFLVPVKLEHDSLDKLQNFNDILVTLNELIIHVFPQLGEETICALYA